eukprot:98747-Pyramimonas_sp.AAC.1
MPDPAIALEGASKRTSTHLLPCRHQNAIPPIRPTTPVTRVILTTACEQANQKHRSACMVKWNGPPSRNCNDGLWPRSHKVM